MNEQELLELKEKPNKSKTEEYIIVNSPQFSDRLAELRNESVDSPWSVIANKLAQEFKVKVNANTIQKKYTEEAAMEIQIDSYAEKQFTKYIGEMSKRYESISNTTDKFHDIVKKVIKELEACDDMDLLALLPDVLKAGKSVETANKMIMGQLQLVRDEQDKITTKLSKNRKDMSDDDIREKIYKHLPDILKSYDAQGKIEILDKSILK